MSYFQLYPASQIHLLMEINENFPDKQNNQNFYKKINWTFR